jgi:glycosyltransferase involved in cell wall biosynthesis
VDDPVSRRVRVALLVDGLHDSSGGGERAVLSIATSLAPERYEVWLITGRLAGGDPLRQALDAGVRHVHLGRTGRIGPRGLLTLVKTMRRERFDVLHANKFGSNLWGTLFGRLLRVPVVIAHEQTWSYEGQPVRRLLDRGIGALAHAFVAVSSRDAERMNTVEKVPREKIVLIPNAWVPRPGAKVGDLRAELGIPADAPVVATVAVMRPQKRLEVLLEAFAAVRAQEPAARLVIAGDGPERPALEAVAQRLALGDAVTFLGRRQDVETIWRGTDVAAMSSDFEGTPLAVLEAMALGVPWVATEVGGLPDIVEHGRTGLLVPKGDAAALAAGLLELLRDPARRAQLGESARERAQDFTARRQAERCEELYERLLMRAAGRSLPSSARHAEPADRR